MFLNNIYMAQKRELKAANIEILKAAKEFDLEIVIGDNSTGVNRLMNKNKLLQLIVIC